MSDPITSEAELIALLAPLAKHAKGAYALKDDCASLTPRTGWDLVFKTDPIRAGVHFFADDPPETIAWKALAVNVSDLAAKGATPLAYLMALSFPETPTRTWMQSFANGLAEAQTVFGCTLIGGDTDKSPGPLSIAITVIGEVPVGRMIQRSTARVGDGIYVSGHLGDSGLGLQLHREAREGRRDLQTKLHIDERDTRLLIKRYLKPQPRLDLLNALGPCASAAMDVSDGLPKDLERMCRASGVGAEIEAKRVPLSSPAIRLTQQDPHALAGLISAGDDYEILATIPDEALPQLRSLSGAHVLGLCYIGRIVEGSGVRFLERDGTTLSFNRPGWDHF